MGYCLHMVVLMILIYYALQAQATYRKEQPQSVSCTFPQHNGFNIFKTMLHTRLDDYELWTRWEMVISVCQHWILTFNTRIQSWHLPGLTQTQIYALLHKPTQHCSYSSNSFWKIKQELLKGVLFILPKFQNCLHLE